ncbi:MAG: response regulator [Pseudomonas sp.]|uniref:response regulator n=1 Tax=Pseudomonas sp. TaxID=306 RepID=UPI0012277EA4|nr:response regulator [Pseudomonas sp.]RZI76699.1 MAG: response regulator [Pseudomonas sp.]
MPDHNRPKVLILEDEPLIAMDLEDALERLGCEVIGPAASCEAALELIWSQDVDAAILDLKIGDGTCEVVADELALSGIPWAFSSGFDRHEVQDRFPAAPIVAKPTDQSRLAEVVGSLVSAPTT